MDQSLSNLMPNEKIMSVKEFEHFVFYGTTNTGKTFKMKTLLVDGIIDIDFEEFIYVGRPEQMEELAKAYAAYLTQKGKNPDAGKMKYFGYTEMKVALAYLNAKHSKIVFFDDIFIQNPKFKQQIASFINQAKNANNTVFLTVHEAYGEQPEKSVRRACVWYAMCCLNSAEISKLTGNMLNTDSEFMYEYIVRDKPTKCLFYNQITQTIFDFNYLSIDSFAKANQDDNE